MGTVSGSSTKQSYVSEHFVVSFGIDCTWPLDDCISM